MKAVLLGGTRGIGRALARQMVERGDRIVLLGRNSEALAQSARDLEIRGGGAPVAWALCDLADSATFRPALEYAQGVLSGFECVIVTAAPFAVQDRLEAEPTLLCEILNIGFVQTILFCEEARRQLLSSGGGTLCVFSSVAGDRGRKPVVLYGAAKAGLSHYLEGMDHRFRSCGLTTICVKPGFVKTGMTAGLKPPPFAAQPEEVARRVLRGIDRGQPEIYAPGIWRWVMFIVRRLPRIVMRRTNF